MNEEAGGRVTDIQGNELDFARCRFSGTGSVAVALPASIC
jgi:hypothetical protein